MALALAAVDSLTGDADTGRARSATWLRAWQGAGAVRPADGVAGVRTGVWAKYLGRCLGHELGRRLGDGRCHHRQGGDGRSMTGRVMDNMVSSS